MFNQWSATGSATNTHTSRLHIVFLKNEKSSDRVRKTGLWCAEICFGSLNVVEKQKPQPQQKATMSTSATQKVLGLIKVIVLNCIME